LINSDFLHLEADNNSEVVLLQALRASHGQHDADGFEQDDEVQINRLMFYII
jgi:hypothetical protein